MYFCGMVQVQDNAVSDTEQYAVHGWVISSAHSL